MILGLDPGSRYCGYGLIDQNGDQIRALDYGTISLPEHLPLPVRLNLLSEELTKIFTRHAIRQAVVERVFFGKNADSAFKLGHARGVCLMMAARFGVDVHEYAARFVKKCVTGSGSATKDQVQLMMRHLLNLPSVDLGVDATDALALAVTHVRDQESRERVRRAMERTL